MRAVNLQAMEDAMLYRFAAYNAGLRDDEFADFGELDADYEAQVNRAWHVEIARSGRAVTDVLAELDSSITPAPSDVVSPRRR